MHSIIIPHRNRHKTLKLCLESVAMSASNCDKTEWEIVLADDSPVWEWGQFPPNLPLQKLKLVPAFSNRKPFNKPRLVNLGLKAASGDVITILDADAIVAPQFMDNAQRLIDDPTLTKLCYRVKNIELTQAKAAGSIADLFADYDSRPCRFEAYGRPHRDMRRHLGRVGNLPVFGNSQFSVRRDILGDLQFNETYVGKGYEDIQFNLQIWKQHFAIYRAEMVTDAQHALYHVTTPAQADSNWGPESHNTLNRRRYMQEFGAWYREMAAKGIKV